MANIVGKIILDQFRVDAFIASGGMGAVYRVWDLRRNVPLAMKVLHANLEMDDPAAHSRFEREARALQKLAHPNIVPFYGLYKTTDFNFLLLRYVGGPTLKEIIRKKKINLPLVEVLTYLKALCSGLGYAHKFGVVHCDVKPGNVMIDRNGVIYLTDFGIARHADSTATSFASGGTPAYMAPEQIRGDPVSPQTDIYSLGIMLFELMTGERPFKATDKVATGSSGATANEYIRFSQLNSLPPNPCEINPEIPVSLGNVILRTLAKQPSNRYISTSALFEAVCLAVNINPNDVPERIILELPPEENFRISALPTSPTPFSRTQLLAISGVITGIFVLGLGAFLTGMVPKVFNLVFSPTITSTPLVISTNTPVPTIIRLPTATSFPTLHPTTNPTSTEEQTIIVNMKVDGLYLYTDMTGSMRVHESTYKRGTDTFEILGKNSSGSWFKVRSIRDGKIGWVQKSWLIINFIPDQIPVVNN